MLVDMTHVSNATAWKQVEKCLASARIGPAEMQSLLALTHPHPHGEHWDLAGLQKTLQTGPFNESLLARIARLALELPVVLPKMFPLLLSGRNGSLTLSQKQISVILANAFFGTLVHQQELFGRSNTDRRIPHLDFRILYQDWIHSGATDSKLNGLLHYFRTMMDRPGAGSSVTFTRRCIDANEFPSWAHSQAPISSVTAFTNGKIEDDKADCLKVDFANKSIGGGVLEQGAVQEEILFIIYPEMLASLLFCEEMKDNEAIFIAGAERFSSYSGYSKSFKWTGGFKDATPCDSRGIRKTEFTAMDALHFRRGKADVQFEEANILRELNKAFCGFVVSHKSPFDQSKQVPVSTGNWGCGAFNGDAELKAMIQVLAASAANRDVRYYTFGDDELSLKLVGVVEYLQITGTTVGSLFSMLLEYKDKSRGESVIDYVMSNL
ncbi:hypothetical protein BJ741DRAFT_593764 [Chytriomyces cf. hyalinus JEL632]|nr:hypothetical protein BJ741DRAFT_593764 [Chytriomyces cf. hyalinus JEL632]